MNQSFLNYKNKIDKLIINSLNKWDNSISLFEVCKYALMQEGKRFRPTLVYMVSEALAKNWDASQAALSIEYFHTASLIADDLPSMDNDSIRRGVPSTHIKHGEASALLASYALISEGYRLISENTLTIRSYTDKADQIGILALKYAAKNTGISGAAGGQYLDLYPPTLDEKTYKETIFKKTVALFEVSMVFGWLFGGGDPIQLPHVESAAYHYGMAFQMADDREDALSDKKGEREMNICTLFGEKRAKKMIEEELDGYFADLDLLNIRTEKLESLAHFIKI